jgi:hypothetical protein
VLAVFADGAALDELGRAITLDLASYLNRPVRCSVTQSTPPVANTWRFEAASRGLALWLDLDVALAAAFADAMIGGDGAGNVGHGRRVRALAEKVALRFFGAIASAAGVEAPGFCRTSTSLAQAGSTLGGGLCAVATDQFAWQAGITFELPVAQHPAAHEPVRLLDHAAGDRAAPDRAAEPGPVTAYASPQDADPEAVLRAAVDALRAHLQELLHCQIASPEPVISRHAGADMTAMPSAALGLALTASGNGAVVAFLNAEGVFGLAAGAVGAQIPMSGLPGDVALAAAEAIVRDALVDVARKLPAIASDAHRIVRLSENPLPARTEHHAADVRFTIGGRTGTLHLLVPSWMLDQSATK